MPGRRFTAIGLSSIIAIGLVVLAFLADSLDPAIAATYPSGMSLAPLRRAIVPALDRLPFFASFPLPSRILTSSSSLLSINKTTSFKRSFTDTPKMASNTSFIEAIQNRRSIYPLTNKSPIPDSRVQELVTEAIKHVPSSFNSQSTRIVVLFNGEHEK